MNNVQKIQYYISNGSLGFMLLRKIGLTNLMSDKAYLKKYFKAALGYNLNLDNPRTFNEKLQWLKLYDRNPQYPVMADKLRAKQYVESVIGGGYIVPTLGVWDSFDQIDFSKLPERFVLKCTHDSGGLVVCRNKNALDLPKAKRKIERCLHSNFYLNGREWQYKDIPRKVIAEEFLDSGDKGLRDYKFFNFNGESRFIYISEGLENHKTASMSFFDFDGNQLPFRRADYKPFKGSIDLPSNFSEMKFISDKLACAINNAFVRTDFYSLNGKIYFSEITFYPNSGLIPFVPLEWDYKLGEMLELPL